MSILCALFLRTEQLLYNGEALLQVRSLVEEEEDDLSRSEVMKIALLSLVVAASFLCWLFSLLGIIRACSKLFVHMDG